MPWVSLAVLSGAMSAQTGPALGELFAADNGARLVQPAGAGMSVVAGSELSAGIAPAKLRLYRGGQVRICPRTNLSVNAGRYGLMFAMGSGTVEIDYTITQRGSDFLITPDFSIQMLGPGTFHFALGVNKKGDTCMKTLQGNNSEVIFSELLSAAVYKTKQEESVSFKGGKLSAEAPSEECGCPAPPPVMVASTAAPPAKPENPPAPGERVLVANSNEATAPLPPDRPGQVHVEVDTPFVFSARGAAGMRPYSVAKIQLSSLPNIYFLQEKVDPIVLIEKPAQVSVKQEAQAPAVSPARKEEKRGFFGHIKGFFGRLFHR